MSGSFVEIEDIWMQFGHKLKKFIEARVPDTNIADDLTQELLIKSYHNIKSLRDSERIEAWLFRVARNVINDYYRKQISNKEELLPEFENILISVESELERNHGFDELINCVEPFVKQLPSKYRRTITAVDLEGSTQKALADELGISYSTVKSQTQRGRALLRKLFRQCCDFSIDSQGNIISFDTKSDQCKCNADC